MNQEPRPVPGTLWIVSTPIGNLGDLTRRAAEVLAAVDLVAAEDTRHTRKLLAHLEISVPLTSYRAHNQAREAPRLTRMLLEGKRIALVTDAGTPGISDPGFMLVRQAADAGVPVVAVPGPSALTAALAVSGFPADRFAFEGFLPQKKGPRRRRLEALASEDRTVALFESPHRILSTLAMLAEICPDRPLVVAREITKLHEEVLRGTALEVAEQAAAAKPRGEYTLVLAKDAAGGRKKDSQ